MLIAALGDLSFTAGKGVGGAGRRRAVDAEVVVDAAAGYVSAPFLQSTGHEDGVVRRRWPQQAVVSRFWLDLSATWAAV